MHDPTKEDRPSSETRAAQKSTATDIPSLPETTDKTPLAALSAEDIAVVLHPACRAAAEDAYGRGRAEGFEDGYLQGRAECIAEHGTVANRIDAAARAFYLLEAGDVAPRQGVRE